MPNDLNKLRRLMKAANMLRMSNPTILRGAQLTQKGALQYAWWFEKFRAKLANGIWRFSYFKLDGSIREAYGTLNMDMIPTEHHPKGGANSDTANFDAFAYFDLKAGGWRSFRLDKFIGFCDKIDPRSFKS